MTIIDFIGFTAFMLASACAIPLLVVLDGRLFVTAVVLVASLAVVAIAAYCRGKEER